MLAWPYGHARLMSSYAFDHGDQGPPSVGGVTEPALDAAGACRDGWICEHRRPSALGMVGFRNSTLGTSTVDHWWDNGNDRIAFGRGGRGFVAINREELGTFSETLDTGLAPGTYCDVVTGARVDGACTGRQFTVDADGKVTFAIEALDAMAIHVDARLDP